FDPTTNRVILHAQQFVFDEVGAHVNEIYNVQIFFNERLYNLFVGLPYEHVSSDGELNYRLRVIYNKNNLVPEQVLIPGTTDNGDYVFKTVKFVQMSQEVSSIALWNPVASIIFASSLLPIQATQTSLPKG
ncbi:MAG: phage minor capsid protein, partial [Candidatus Fonsibacter sp.]